MIPADAVMYRDGVRDFAAEAVVRRRRYSEVKPMADAAAEAEPSEVKPKAGAKAAGQEHVEEVARTLSLRMSSAMALASASGLTTCLPFTLCRPWAECSLMVSLS